MTRIRRSSSTFATDTSLLRLLAIFSFPSPTTNWSNICDYWNQSHSRVGHPNREPCRRLAEHYGRETTAWYAAVPSRAYPPPAPAEADWTVTVNAAFRSAT